MSQNICIIIEWENAKLSELERAERMLRQLGQQVRDATRARGITAELIVLYDDEEIDENVPRTAINSQIDPATWPGEIRVVPAPGQRYYEQKNTGAKLASHDLLVFLDSDVVPDDGWLEGLLKAMESPDVGYVGGETYHATETFHDRMFAAFWTFTTRRPSRGLYPYKNFYANNLAVRRDLFLANPYPDASAYRGQCSELAKQLRSKGVPIHRQGDSTVSHPPPVGARTFFVRALCQGYDAVYWKNKRRLGRLLNTNPIACLWRMLRQWWRVTVNVFSRARIVGLGPLGVLAALGAGFAYYLVKFTGEVVSFFAPNVIRENFSV